MLNLLLSAFLHVPVILILTLVTLGLAISFAARPGERKLAALRPMSVATILALLSATCAGVGAALRNAANAAAEGGGGDASKMLTAGCAEAMVPAVFGFAVLSLAWVLVAVGLRRQL